MPQAPTAPSSQSEQNAGQDWFAANAPKPADSGGDWFDKQDQKDTAQQKNWFDENAPSKTDSDWFAKVDADEAAKAKSDGQTKPTDEKKDFDVLGALGGMHGGSYDIAFRDSKGQISRETLESEALGGSAGVTADLSPAVMTALRAAAVAHPVAAKVIVKGLEGLGFGAGLKLSKQFADLFKP